MADGVMQINDIDPSVYIKDFRSEIYWISSDRAEQFDRYLGMPIKDRSFFKHQIRDYLKYKQSLQPGDPSAIGDAAFDKALAALRAHGEDVDRLLLWFGALSTHMGDDDKRHGAYLVWENALGRWVRGQASPPKHLPENRLKAFVATFANDAYWPGGAFGKLVEQSQAAWMADPKSRTPWDNYLWDVYFKEVFINPGVFFKLYYNDALNRQWWRENHTMLDDDEQEKLLSDLIDNIQSHGDAETQDWSVVMPIKLAFDIDRIPDFAKYKRDW